MNNLTGPFLTDLDDRARVKGSRDPLGAQPIWTRFGRHVIGNLTTVTTSLRDFTTLLLGYYFAERVAEEAGTGSEVETFLKWEQLAAYSRAYVNQDYSFRGTERVQATVSAGPRATLSAAPATQILSDQKTYGLWGLYTVPGTASGFIERDRPILTPAAQDFVIRQYLPAVVQAGFPNADRIVEILSRPQYQLELAKRDAGLIECIARLLKRRVQQAERTFYGFHLLEGGPVDSTDGRQGLLATILSELPQDTAVNVEPTTLRAIAKEAKSRGAVGEALAFRLDRIRACESVLAPSAVLFAYLQGCDGKTVALAASRVRQEWGPSVRSVNIGEVKALREEFAAVRDDCADRLVALAEALAQGAYEQVVRLLIEQNLATMQLRGGAAWIEERNGRLKIRVRNELGALPPRATLGSLWRFSYFLDSLLALTVELRVK